MFSFKNLIWSRKLSSGLIYLQLFCNESKNTPVSGPLFVPSFNKVILPGSVYHQKRWLKHHQMLTLLLYSCFSYWCQGASPPDKRQVSVTSRCPGKREFGVSRKIKCQSEQPSSGGQHAKERLAKKDDPEWPAPAFGVRIDWIKITGYFGKPFLLSLRFSI